MCKLLIGNKTDLTGNRQVSTKEANSLAKSLGVPYIETSAKSSANVEEMFLRMARFIKKKRAAKEFQNDDKGINIGATIGGGSPIGEGSSCC